MVTGKTLDDQIYDQSLGWWVGSVPPYYCYNPSTVAGNDDLSSDSTWLGTSMDSTAGPGVPIQYTNGVKFAVAGPTGENPGNLVKYYDGAGQTQNLIALSDPAGVYSPPAQYLQSTYKIGSKNPGGDPMYFGPYDLTLTDSSPTDGDIIFITTGSDVIGGALEDGAVALAQGDNRSYNLIFYSTGSSNVQKLSIWVGDQNQTGRGASVELVNYDVSERRNWYNKCAVNGFVGIRSVSSAAQVTWWPLTYDDTTVEVIASRNDS